MFEIVWARFDWGSFFLGMIACFVAIWLWSYNTQKANARAAIAAAAKATKVVSDNYRKEQK